MATLWVDSFNSYGTTADMNKAYGSSSSATITLNLTGGPDASPCFKSTSSGGAELIATLYSAPSSTICGGRMRFKQSAHNTGATSTFIKFGTRSSGLVANTWTLNVATSGLVTAQLAASSSAAGTGSTDVCDAAYHLIEWQTDLKDAGGTIKVWVNGTLEINIGPTDTYSGTTAHATTPWLATGFTLLGSGNVVDRYIDDLIVFDDSVAGGLRTSAQPYGNLVIETLRPNGAGTTTQFTPSAGANYECVDETAQDGDISYVESAVSGNRDLYTLSNLVGTPATVYGVISKCHAKNTGSGSISMNQVIKSGATTTVGTTTVASVAGDYKVTSYDINPDGSTAWTETTVNALEAGFEVD